jgi:hypothetical protein
MIGRKQVIANPIGVPTTRAENHVTVWRAGKGERAKLALCEVKNETDS